MRTYEEKIADIMNLRLIDDVFFEAFAANKKAVQEILRVILEDDGLEVLEVVTQGDEHNIYGRSVRLDALCTLGNGTKCNIEVQRSDNDDHARRARYNGSMITVKESEPGIMFKDVTNVLIVYISETDIFKGGKTIYHVEKRLRETGALFDDGFNEVFVNTAVNDGSRIADLMSCFTKKELNDEQFPETTAEVQRLKTTEGGLSAMCEVMERYVTEARAEGKAEGKTEGEARLSALIQKLIEARSYDDIAKATSDKTERERLYKEFGL